MSLFMEAIVRYLLDTVRQTNTAVYILALNILNFFLVMNLKLAIGVSTGPLLFKRRFLNK